MVLLSRQLKVKRCASVPVAKNVCFKMHPPLGRNQAGIQQQKKHAEQVRTKNGQPQHIQTGWFPQLYENGK